MTIKQKITISFAITVATLLLVFSVFIYVSFQSYRRNLMRSRLERRAQSAEMFLREPVGFQGTTALALTEQYEAIFDQNDSLIYSSAARNDYVPTESFLETVRRTGKLTFTYAIAHWQYPKEGVALRFVYQRKTYVALVTVYDLQGRQAGQNLLYILLAGNGLLLLVTAVAAYIFARRAMQPFDFLIRQLNQSSASDFSFRLYYPQQAPVRRPDEAGYLSSAFNRLLESLQKLANSQQHFVSYASHELRTPLTVVKGQLETAIDYDQSLPAAKQSMQAALRKLDQAIGLSNALLRLAEIEGLNTDLPRQEVNLADLVMDTADNLTQKYPSQALNVQLTPTFLEASAGFRLMGLPHLLRTVLISITDNACKYSSHQPVELRVDFQTALPDFVPLPPISAANFVVISVADQGIGIPTSALANIRMPLMRADNVGRIEGFGLGLTLASKIVELHHGYLHVDSKLGQGTTVWVFLPVEPIE